VLPATTVARAVQIENKIRAVIKVQFTMEIPLVYSRPRDPGQTDARPLKLGRTCAGVRDAPR
jgi:hypothetical protein